MLLFNLFLVALIICVDEEQLQWVVNICPGTFYIYLAPADASGPLGCCMSAFPWPTLFHTLSPSLPLCMWYVCLPPPRRVFPVLYPLLPKLDNHVRCRGVFAPPPPEQPQLRSAVHHLHWQGISHPHWAVSNVCFVVLAKKKNCIAILTCKNRRMEREYRFALEMVRTVLFMFILRRNLQFRVRCWRVSVLWGSFFKLFRSSILVSDLSTWWLWGRWGKLKLPSVSIKQRR